MELSAGVRRRPNGRESYILQSIMIEPITKAQVRQNGSEDANKALTAEKYHG